MDSNTHSVGAPAGLAALVAELQGLADQDPDRLADGALAERVMTLRGLMDRLQGHWLGELAAVDARGAAGADHGVQAGATAGWLGPGCAWVPAPPPAWCAPPGRCTAAP
jgi:hypothetical protein